MYPQNNYYYQQPTQAQFYTAQPQSTLMTSGLKGRQVSSFEEARATTIDFDGSTFFFPDLANKKIYTKQINIDGTASLCVYELKQQPAETTVNANFITREEFEKVINELRACYMAMSQSAQSPTTSPAAPVAKPDPNIAKLF